MALTAEQRAKQKADLLKAMLGQNYGFGDLANYEEARRNDFAGSLEEQLAQRRSQLSSSLNNQGVGLFEEANPGILEDLNARGLFTSPSAVNERQTEALKSIGLSNQQYLNQYDDQATAAILQSKQDALDSGLDLQRADLESRLQGEQSAKEEALARDLAKQQGRNGLIGSLIGAGGSIGGAALLSGAFKGTAAATIPAAATAYGAGGAAAGGGSVFGGGLGMLGANPLSAYGTTTGATAAGGGLAPGLGTLAAGGIGIPLAGWAASGISKYAQNRVAEKAGTTAGEVAGAVANPIGYTINKTKALINDPKQTLGNAYDSVVKKPVNQVAKSLKKVFCFDALTPIDMADGTQKYIKDIDLGDETKGGLVESIRVSMSGDLYTYLGIIVTGSHAVLENGSWVRIEDAYYAIPIEGKAVVYSIVTDKHRVYSQGVTLADEHETDLYESLNMEQSLARMNHEDGLVGVN